MIDISGQPDLFGNIGPSPSPPSKAHRWKPKRLCVVDGCNRARVGQRDTCSPHTPEMRPGRGAASHGICRICGQPHHWYESSLSLNWIEQRRDIARSICARCRRRHMQTITRHNLDVDWAVRLIRARECELCHERFPIGKHGQSMGYIDHDHACCATERTCGHCARGVVCPRCNARIAAFEDVLRYVGIDKMFAYLDQR